MKKIYFIIAAVAMLFAIEAKAQIGVGVGYNMLSTSYGEVAESESLNGFYIEATYDYNFLNDSWGSLAVQPGVRFTYAGTSETEETFGLTASKNETYLDIPVLVKYTYDLDALKLSAFAGPVISCGLSSSSSLSGDGESLSASNYGEDGVYGRFDIKLGLGIGATFMEKYNAKIGYNVGLLNRYTGESDAYNIRTGVFYLGIGYNF